MNEKYADKINKLDKKYLTEKEWHVNVNNATHLRT
jgi:hypothetical protein